MAKLSKETTEEVMEFPLAIDRSCDLEGYAVNFVSIIESHDLAPMLKALPGGHCSCPHSGYLFSGRLTIIYGDTTKVIQAGDAFYMPPGHTPAAHAGTEFVMLQISSSRRT